MSSELKPIVSMAETFDRLDIRLGRILTIERALDAPKTSYKITADFGRFGVKTSVGRFTNHTENELKDALIFGVLNLETRTVGTTVSEFLTLGVQYPKADSGEATLITTMNKDAKIGSKLF